MISSNERPRRGRTLEIAILVSLMLHLLVGAFSLHRSAKLVAERAHVRAADRELTATSTAIRIEKRTIPRAAPPVRQAARPLPPRPRVVTHPAAGPIVPRPVIAKTALPQTRPTEIARIAASAPPAPARAAKGRRVTQSAGAAPEAVEVARIAPPKTHSEGASKFSPAQIAAMQQRFSQTIKVARASVDPTHVAPQGAAATMKHYKLDVAGIDDLLRRGEGFLTIKDEFAVKGGTCYYTDFDVQFPDGSTDRGHVWWPICYRPSNDPFKLHVRHFPLPPPAPDWQLPERLVPDVAQHPVLRPYFPDRFPE